MITIRNTTKLMIFIYVIVALAIWYYKPAIIFSEDDTKRFGVGYNRTVFNYSIVLMFIAMIIFYLFEIVKSTKNNIF